MSKLHPRSDDSRRREACPGWARRALADALAEVEALRAENATLRAEQASATDPYGARLGGHDEEED